MRGAIRISREPRSPEPRRLRGRLPLGLAAALACALLFPLASCRPERGEASGPIVLVTFDSLRADAVGAWNPEVRGLTPNLDGLIREASWSGPAVASSSSDAPAMASLFTGLSVWQHQVLTSESPRLDGALETLPEALKRRGYKTVAYSGSEAYSKTTGFHQGFDAFEKLRKGEEAEKEIAALRGAPTFLWVHIPEPQAPYIRRPKLARQVGLADLGLPQRILPQQLAPFFDPSQPPPPGRLRRFQAMYRYNVAYADERLGRLLQALRAAGAWDRTLVVVASTHGEEFGEKGQVLSGGNLGRRLIEVPAIVKLPSWGRRPVALAKGERPAAGRLFATIVEAAGGAAAAAAAPSLFRRAPAGALSELYRGNGSNLFSWVEGDDQLTLESRFAPPEADYYRAVVAGMTRGPGRGGRAQRAARAEAAEDPDAAGAVLRRIDAAFVATPALLGGESRRLTLERWTRTGTAPSSDDRKAAAMAAALEAAWNRFQAREIPPDRERREWYTRKSH